jgi:NRPS condensation-like uncharacterized protein
MDLLQSVLYPVHIPSLECHRADHAASDSNAYTVAFEVDCESGGLTITVDRADESCELTACARFLSAGDGCRRTEQTAPIRARCVGAPR